MFLYCHIATIYCELFVVCSATGHLQGRLIADRPRPSVTTVMTDLDGREIGREETTAIALAVEKDTAHGDSALAHVKDSDEREAVLRKEGTTGGTTRAKGAGRGVVPMTTKGNMVVATTASDHVRLSEGEANVVGTGRAEIEAHGNGT